MASKGARSNLKNNQFFATRTQIRVLVSLPTGQTGL